MPNLRVDGVVCVPNMGKYTEDYQLKKVGMIGKSIFKDEDHSNVYPLWKISVL